MMNSKKKILVVDDDTVLLNMTKDLLEFENEQFEVITHLFGVGAADLARALQPDLVLLDINMPVLSGDKLAAQMRMNADTGHIPIVFYSSNDEDSLRESVAASGVRGYICKGNISDLRNKVNQYLNIPTVEKAGGIR